MRKLGIVVFSSHSGLGNQSRRITQLVQPERILLIDSSPFSQNKDQHPEWYEGFNGYIARGAPTDRAVDMFLKNLTHLFIMENPLNWRLVTRAHQLGIKVYFHCNYEFCDNLNQPHLPLPDKFIMPSYWMMDAMKQKFGVEKVEYLPPPIDPSEFKEARERNFARRGPIRLLHTVGTLAAKDRNGTLLLLAALEHTTTQFTLVIKSQHVLPTEYMTNDPRVTYKFGSDPSTSNIYQDFDAMILPRRFGGLCLPLCEAMMAGLPVIMPDISPNNALLPKEWLVAATKTDTLKTRALIDLYSVGVKALAKKIDWLIEQNLDIMKTQAFDLAHQEFAQSSLRSKYENLWL